ncbi:bifunctional phosphoribosylaminoimidazolecarboxamide formyltransferase/IMP cyclohydrolase [Anaerolineales bacterium]
MPRALISVSDKSGLIELSKVLDELGWEIVASGGTAQHLIDNKISVTPIEQLTGVTELLNGRVKTLHPAVHAGILARDKQEDLDQLYEHGYAPISMVICNLYPFQKTTSTIGSSLQDAIENIDIGGVTLLRAAAKNFFRVSVICDPHDYDSIINSLKISGDIDLATRRTLAVKAFALTRDYDTAIHSYLAPNELSDPVQIELPAQTTIALHSVQTLRYGENPHQVATYYASNPQAKILDASQIGGKELSYNNILDVDAAWRTVNSFTSPTSVIVKHLTPTGVASDENISTAFQYALESDPISAFGGVLAFNRQVDAALVNQFGSLFIEAIAAPNFTQEAIEKLLAGRKNCRLLMMNKSYDTNGVEFRSIHGGWLAQQIDSGGPDGMVPKIVTERSPSEDELKALQFNWIVSQHVKTNAIVIGGLNRTFGVGGGLPSRVAAVEFAVKKAGEKAQDAVLASDAFFPFRDPIEAAAQAGIKAIIQPGGAIRDNQVIEAANAAGMAMVFTGTRHFRH